MAVNYSDALVHMVQCKIDAARSGKIPPITAFEDIMELFVEHNIVRVEVVHPSLVFVHTCNRGGLGLNPHNAHRNGAIMKSVGCDPSELHKSLVIEMSPLEPKRSEQMAFNIRLIEAAKGLLAQPTGRERLLSLGGGHFLAFFRAVLEGCKTP